MIRPGFLSSAERLELEACVRRQREYRRVHHRRCKPKRHDIRQRHAHRKKRRDQWNDPARAERGHAANRHCVQNNDRRRSGKDARDQHISARRARRARIGRDTDREGKERRHICKVLGSEMRDRHAQRRRKDQQNRKKHRGKEPYFLSAPEAAGDVDGPKVCTKRDISHVYILNYTPSPAEAEFDVLTAGFRTIHLCP